MGGKPVMTQTVKSSMSWFFLLLVIVFGIATMILVALDGTIEYMFATTAEHAESESSQTGLSTLETVWNYWPLWLLGMLVIAGYSEAVRKSSPGGGVR